MKVIGILGGLGPEASSQCYLSLVKKSYRINPKSFPPILIWNIPLSKQMDDDMMAAPPTPAAKQLLITHFQDAIERVERAGADILILPCNTAHCCYSHLKPSRSIFLSIIHETVSYILDQAKTWQSLSSLAIGVLATCTTVQSGLYTNALAQAGIQYVLPNQCSQMKLMDAIESILKDGPNDCNKAIVVDIAQELAAEGANVVLLGCTELPLVFDDDDGNLLGLRVVNTMDVLENRALELAFSLEKEE